MRRRYVHLRAAGKQEGENGAGVSMPTKASIASLFPTGSDLLRRLVTKPFRMWTFGV